MSAKDDLIAEAKSKGIAVPEGATKAEVQALLDDFNAQTEDTEETTPAEQAAEDVDKSGDHTSNEDHPEEAAAARAGVPEERLDNPKQNRDPKNDFEQENQKVTEVERQAAQKASDMTTAERVESAPEPSAVGQDDASKTVATNQGSEIAAAIVAGLKESKNDNFALQAEPGVEHRFTLVKNKQTGEVMIRENETGTLSKIQLLSIEEKEADVQKTEVEEL